MDTQNKAWAEDKSGFGYRMLAKMGWSEGKGLGVNEDGMTSHIRAKRRRTNGGVGTDCRASAQWKVPGAVASGFNDVLARIATPQSPGDSPDASDGEASDAIVPPTKGVEPVSGKGQSYFARRARQKNVGQYTPAQLREIFGGAAIAPVAPVVSTRQAEGVAKGRVGKKSKRSAVEKKSKKEEKGDRKERKERRAKRKAEKAARRAKRDQDANAKSSSD